MATAKKRKARGDKPRWLYRFKNYKRAFRLLSEAIDLFEERELSSLEQEGVIQRFEYTWELGWNLLADLLDADGITLDTRTPRAAIRAAYKAKIISNGKEWMNALDARNRMAHTYDESDFAAIVEEIQSTYLGLLDALHRTGLKREAALK
ncbi:MAG: hypothetical protein A4S17_09515 [Proteobacteria bacterium HN_bin10]|nr:MAG: hypothetical protein A4S17_09515 [Proteobacteria bacterium HN_bin10]